MRPLTDMELAEVRCFALAHPRCCTGSKKCRLCRVLDAVEPLFLDVEQARKGQPPTTPIEVAGEYVTTLQADATTARQLVASLRGVPLPQEALVTLSEIAELLEREQEDRPNA